tara:strand:+ start:1355 stop:1672 length:318 start_codon:yes stop_codon:yes gene_type:complete
MSTYEEDLLKPKDRYFAFVDASFQVGDTPATHDVETSLNKKSIDGFIKCTDTVTGIDIEISSDGTNFGDIFTLDPEESLNLVGLEVSKIRVSRKAADSAYKIFVS